MEEKKTEHEKRRRWVIKEEQYKIAAEWLEHLGIALIASLVFQKIVTGASLRDPVVIVGSIYALIIGKYLSSFPILAGISKFCIISEFKDWFESESRAPGALITSGMSPLSVYSQISDERFKGPTQPGSIAMAEGAKQLG